MRIIYFHQHFSTPQGSIGTRSYEFAKRLVARGHEVTIVCGSYTGAVTGISGEYVRDMRRGEVDGIDIIEFRLPYSNADRFLKRTFVFLKFVLRSLKLALSSRYDVVFATSTPLTVSIMGIAAKIVRRRRFIFEVRDLWPELPREMGVITNPMILGMMGALESLAYRSADACIGLAPGIVAGIHRKVPGKRTAMIPNGSDLQVGPRERSTELPAIMRTLAGKLTCIFTGAHGIANGLDAVLDAAAELKRRGCADVALLFIGDGRLKPSLVRRAQLEDLSNCFFIEPMPKHLLVQLQMDVGVGLMVLADVPAFYNGTSPNKFFDYLAAGLPIVINYPGWLAGIVTQRRCGIAVPPGDPIAFADALERLARSPRERADMGSRARRLAEEEFSREKLAAQFVDFLEGVIDDKARV